MFAFTKLSLARQFLLLSLIILLTGMVVIGSWVHERIELAVTNRTAAVTALYVDSFVSPHLQSLGEGDSLLPSDLETLDDLLAGTALGQQIVSFKIWSPEGEILYSPNSDLVGKRFSINGDLAQALGGEVNSEVSDLTEAENSYESQQWDALIETYAPIRLNNSGEVIAVSEFYQMPDALMAEIKAAQFRSWLVVGSATLTMYLLLAGMVGRASNLILTQQTELEHRVVQLNSALSEVRTLQSRIRGAAARTTALSERFLQRVSADLHDGPAQNMSLALLRLGALAKICNECPEAVIDGQPVARDLETIQKALSSALADVRAIAEGLQLPEVEGLSLEDTVRRVVRDYERLTGGEVNLSTTALPVETPLPVRIALYRILQEALSNGYRHANGVAQTVSVLGRGEDLWVEVKDGGGGFDQEKPQEVGSRGLTGMRERVELLGGEFGVESMPGHGTILRARLPLTTPEEDHG
ncbi:MAG: sensor histidine kinase [Planctomycetota bacterium]|jgi:signal transduction histidine kinase